MFNSQQGNLLTLNDLSDDFESEYGVSISKQGLDARFNAQSVDFLNQLLSNFLSNTISANRWIEKNANFSSCNVRDSTRFGLPDLYASVYKGHGGARKTKAMISIQYEMDLLSGNQMDIQLTSGCRNDQQDAKESCLNIEDNALLIRDLGYITTTYLKSVIEQNAFFLNRLPSQMFVYNQDKDNAKVDIEKLYKKMKRFNLPFIELNILAGKTAQIPCRLIVYLNDEKTMRHGCTTKCRFSIIWLKIDQKN